MFRNVPECSGMFRHVPCSGFYRRPSVPVSTQIYGLSAPIPEEIVLAISLTCLDHEKY